MTDDRDPNVMVEAVIGDEQIFDDEMPEQSLDESAWADLRAERSSGDSAADTIERFYPEHDDRIGCLTVLADSIAVAHSKGAHTWGVTLFPRRLVRLNVGSIQVVVLLPGELYLTVDTDSLPAADFEWLQQEAHGQWSGYFKTIPTAYGLHIPIQRLDDLLPVVHESHQNLVLKAATTIRQPMAEAHSPGVLTYLRQELKREIPSSEYSSTSGRSAKFAQNETGAGGSRSDQERVINTSIPLARSLATEGLHFTPWQIATFYTALQTKGFVILSGISGTGKTKLAQHFAALLPTGTSAADYATDYDNFDAVANFSFPTSSLATTLSVGQVSIPVPKSAEKTNILYPFDPLKRMNPLFEPPSPGKAVDIEVLLGDQREKTRITTRIHSRGQYVVELHLSPNLKRWLARQTLPMKILAAPEFNDHNQLVRLRILSEDVELSMSNDTESTIHSEPGADHSIASGSAERADEFRGGRMETVLAQDVMSNALFLSVRPDWCDSKSLLGYYNPLTETYEWTPFLRFIQRAADRYAAADGLAWFVILDEMNMAQVEYYFADLLSVLESGRDADGWTREPLRLGYPDHAEGDLPPPELRLPPSLYIIGTVNMDETTHAFSPKVLDRAFTIELTEVDFSNYPVALASSGDTYFSDQERQRLLDEFSRRGRFAMIDKDLLADYVADRPEVRLWLQQLNELLHRFNLHFGYRVFDEIVAFLMAADQNGLFADLNEMAAFDAAVLMKVLPKFHGSRGKLEGPLRSVLAWCINPAQPNRSIVDQALSNVEDADAASNALANLAFQCPQTADRARRMLWALYTDGFAAFG